MAPQRFIVYVNKGDHGFHNGDMDMKMIFRAFGPEFKSDFVAEPFDSIHIYPLMCRLLGVRPEPNNGSLLFTEDMLLAGGEDQHTHTHAHTHTHTHTHARTLARTNTQTQTHTRTHTHTQTDTHAHTQSHDLSQSDKSTCRNHGSP